MCTRVPIKGISPATQNQGRTAEYKGLFRSRPRTQVQTPALSPPAVTSVAPQASGAPDSSGSPHRVPGMRRETRDAFHKSIWNTAKPWTNCPMILRVPSKQDASGGPTVGTIWASCPGSACQSLEWAGEGGTGVTSLQTHGTEDVTCPPGRLGF